MEGIRSNNNLNTMDDEGSKQNQNSDSESSTEPILQSVRVRHSILHDFRINRFIRNYHRFFLPAFAIISWFIFILTKN
jgi:hypothetical protein